MLKLWVTIYYVGYAWFCVHCMYRSHNYGVLAKAGLPVSSPCTTASHALFLQSKPCMHRRVVFPCMHSLCMLGNIGPHTAADIQVACNKTFADLQTSIYSGHMHEYLLFVSARLANHCPFMPNPKHASMMVLPNRI